MVWGRFHFPHWTCEKTAEDQRVWVSTSRKASCLSVSLTHETMRSSWAGTDCTEFDSPVPWPRKWHLVLPNQCPVVEQNWLELTFLAFQCQSQAHGLWWCEQLPPILYLYIQILFYFFLFCFGMLIKYHCTSRLWIIVFLKTDPVLFLSFSSWLSFCFVLFCFVLFLLQGKTIQTLYGKLFYTKGILLVSMYFLSFPLVSQFPVIWALWP